MNALYDDLLLKTLMSTYKDVPTEEKPAWLWWLAKSLFRETDIGDLVGMVARKVMSGGYKTSFDDIAKKIKEVLIEQGMSDTTKMFILMAIPPLKVATNKLLDATVVALSKS